MKIGEDCSIRNGSDSIRVVFKAFPDTLQGQIKAFSAQLDRNKWLIMIDSTLSKQAQRFTIGHELCHILEGHISQGIEISLAEKTANKRAWHYYRVFRDSLSA